MSLDPVTAVLDIGKTVIDRIWPNKTEQEKAELAAALSIVQSQLEINKAEASNASVFVSGWRPAIGWVCGAGCAWNWVGLPMAKFALDLLGKPIMLSPADLSEMMPLLLGMLGLGSLRTVEKINKVASK